MASSPPSAPPASPSSRPTKPPESSRITAPTPFVSLFREDLASDEHTAVFSPNAELLARSGRQPPPGSAWEEPTQVVHLGDAFAALASSPSNAPPPFVPSVEQQLDFERKLAELATPVPAPEPRTRWFLWALVAILIGAGLAAVIEYRLHPVRAGAPSPTGAGVRVERR
jgi:hypothetical protein